jgi:cardiolipin synthase
MNLEVMDGPWLAQLQFWVPIVLVTIIGPAAALHALLHKREPSGAFGWIAVCLIFPLAGPILYTVFGINRVQIRARRLDRRAPHSLGARDRILNADSVERHGIDSDLAGLVRAGDALTQLPLLEGNAVEALPNGERAYPAMLQAIESATKFVYLTTYIFETNKTGKLFMDVLAAAAQRGVDVRVLIDGVGEYYSWPRRRPVRRLRKRGVRVARFLPPRLLPPSLRINLRNHRKILVVDGRVAFTGGMNIGDRHLLKTRGKRGVEDLHFQIDGPVVSQIEEVFLGDWAFTTGRHTELSNAATGHPGKALCRAVEDGPTEDANRLGALLAAAASTARRRVWIMTPYFLPSRELAGALVSAALRGLDVSIILPGRNNLAFVHWASRHGLEELLASGIKVFYREAPFVHTKLFLVDDDYVLVGSANIDPRSLRLNFELGIEIYNRGVAENLAGYILDSRNRSRRYTLEDLRNRGYLARLRDSVFWLFSPYL